MITSQAVSHSIVMSRLLRSCYHLLSKPTRSFTTTSTNEGRLDGRVAILTAGTTGIGLAMAKSIAQDGAHVVVSSRASENVEKAVKEIESAGLKVSGAICHVGKPEERKELIESTVKTFGGFDILVSNAAVNPYWGPFLDTPESVFDKTFDVNVKSNFCLIRDCVPHMENRKTQGAVLITSSIGGYLPDILPGAYVISKGALFCMTRTFAVELIERNIRVNCVAVGPVDTKFAEAIKTIPGLLKDKIFPRSIMKRVGRAEECGGIAAFLCSDDASFITGEVYSVSGGIYTR